MNSKFNDLEKTTSYKNSCSNERKHEILLKDKEEKRKGKKIKISDNSVRVSQRWMRVVWECLMKENDRYEGEKLDAQI